MRRQLRLSLFQRITRRKADSAASYMANPEDQLPPDVTSLALSGSALEQAYRDLLLENQVLAETNQCLHDRQLRDAEDGEQSTAAKELIQAQRKALAERSRRMRELEYENTQLKREQKKLIEENRQLSECLARYTQDMQPLLRERDRSRRELADAKAALRDKSNELLRLTDKYYQLEARTRPDPPPTAANSDF